MQVQDTSFTQCSSLSTTFKATLNGHCLIPETITNVENGQAVLEILNVSSVDTYINLNYP